MRSSPAWLRSSAYALLGAALTVAPTLTIAQTTVAHCAKFVTYKQQACQSKLVKEKGGCDCDSFITGSGQTCDGDGLYRGKGMEAHEAEGCGISWGNPLGCDTEWCLGVTCEDKVVNDVGACAECSAGYQFAAPSTSHTYTEIKIGELCDNGGGCAAGYRKGNIHATSAGICNDKLMFGHSGDHTYNCEKQVTKTIAPFTNECKLKPVFCGEGQYVDDRQCKTCPDGQFQYETNHKSNVCKPQRECKQGQYMLGASPSKNGNCKGCPAGQYQQQAAHRAIACIKQPTCSGATTYLSGGGNKEPGTCEDHPTCSVGQYYSGGSASQIGRCSSCQTGKYQDAVGHRETSCMQQAKCSSGQFMSVANNDVKASKGVCEACPAGQHQTASNHQNIECKAQATCGAGQRLVGAATTKGTCEDCAPGEYQNHTSHQKTACMLQPECDAAQNLVLVNDNLEEAGDCECNSPSYPDDVTGACITPTTTESTKVVGDDNAGGGGDGDGDGNNNGDDSNGDGNNGGDGNGDNNDGDGGKPDGDNNNGGPEAGDGISNGDDSSSSAAAASTDPDDALADESNKTPVAVVVVVAVLLVVILTVLLLLFRQRKQNTDDDGVAWQQPASGGGGGGMPVAGESNPMYDAMAAGNGGVQGQGQGVGAGPPLPPDDDLDGYGDAEYGVPDGDTDASYGDVDADTYGDSMYGGDAAPSGGGQGYLDVAGGPGNASTVTSTMYDNADSHSNSTIYAIPMADDGAAPGEVVIAGSKQMGTIVAQRNGGETYEVLGEGLYAPAQGNTMEARARAGSVYQGFNGDGDSEL